MASLNRPTETNSEAILEVLLTDETKLFSFTMKVPLTLCGTFPAAPLAGAASSSSLNSMSRSSFHLPPALAVIFLPSSGRSSSSASWAALPALISSRLSMPTPPCCSSASESMFVKACFSSEISNTGQPSITASRETTLEGRLVVLHQRHWGN